MATITDLDALLGSPRRVTLGGEEYKLPADCPSELYLTMLQVNAAAGADAGVDELDIVSRLHSGILELFQVYQPDMERLPAEMSVQMMVRMIGAVYNADEGEGEAAPPTKRTRKRSAAGTPSTKSRPKTASRSSAS